MAGQKYLLCLCMTLASVQCGHKLFDRKDRAVSTKKLQGKLVKSHHHHINRHHNHHEPRHHHTSATGKLVSPLIRRPVHTYWEYLASNGPVPNDLVQWYPILRDENFWRRHSRLGPRRRGDVILESLEPNKQLVSPIWNPYVGNFFDVPLSLEDGRAWIAPLARKKSEFYNRQQGEDLAYSPLKHERFLSRYMQPVDLMSFNAKKPFDWLFDRVPWRASYRPEQPLSKEDDSDDDSENYGKPVDEGDAEEPDGRKGLADDDEEVAEPIIRPVKVAPLGQNMIYPGDLDPDNPETTTIIDPQTGNPVQVAGGQVGGQVLSAPPVFG